MSEKLGGVTEGSTRVFGELAEVTVDAGGYQVTLFEELDGATVPLLEQATADLWSQPAGVALVIDLSGLNFIDSSGLLALIRLSHRCQLRGRKVGFLRPPRAVDVVFRLTGTDRTLPFLD